jgi:hypothetical protein
LGALCLGVYGARRLKGSKVPGIAMYEFFEIELPQMMQLLVLSYMLLI